MTDRLADQTCAFDPCDAVAACSFEQGCVIRRYPPPARTERDLSLRDDAKKLNGVKPSRRAGRERKSA